MPLLLVAVAIVFLFMRPFNAPYAPVIGGDGLGYYSYLPATFIYDDADYQFKWFNAAHDSNYVYSAFPNPEDNLLVKYRDRKINKYYPGLSVLWIPFFTAGHLGAHLTGYKPDGFSAPYQLSVWIASLFYILTGLWLLHRLLLRTTASQLAATLVPGALFFGTYLFIYSINGNTLSHAYSFTLITAFFLSLQVFFSDPGNKSVQSLICLITFTLLVTVRPLTGLVLLALPAFVPRDWRFPPRENWKISVNALLLLLLFVAIIWYEFRIIYIQTGTLLPYTYEGESFNFSDPWFIEALFGYRLGLFVYAPVLLLAFFGLPFMPARSRVMFPLLFLTAVFLYSAWWYWPILIRALVDFYVLPGICLAYLLARSKGTQRLVVIVLIVICVGYFQFKSYQVRNGILAEFGTYKEIFWRNFFRMKPASMYLVPPETIRSTRVFTEDFENYRRHTTNDESYGGKSSLLLDSTMAITSAIQAPYPDNFLDEGFKKVRLSFQCKTAGTVDAMHVFLVFKDSAGSTLRETAFYLHKANLEPGSWDLKEFGTELAPEDSLGPGRVHGIGVGLWNVNARGRIYVDDLKLEFLVTDKSYETIEMERE